MSQDPTRPDIAPSSGGALETYEQAWLRRRGMRCEVDFTMMYVGHDAFARDLERLVSAAERGNILGLEARATWATFVEMLSLHHRVEDAALWPPLRAATRSPDDHALLDAMEAEHAGIDPRIEAIDKALAQAAADDLIGHLQQLQQHLHAHMLHEEDQALPLLERTLGAAGWAAFGAEAQKQGGIRSAATLLPWSLEGASPEVTSSVLSLIPLPARVIYHRRWARRYARSTRLH